jgi:hypothetical protein
MTLYYKSLVYMCAIGFCGLVITTYFNRQKIDIMTRMLEAQGDLIDAQYVAFAKHEHGGKE